MHGKPLLISVGTDDAKGAELQPLLPSYMDCVLSCRGFSCLIGEAAVFIV